MSWIDDAVTTTVPDDGLLFFNATTNEYYLITMSGEILTWST